MPKADPSVQVRASKSRVDRVQQIAAEEERSVVVVMNRVIDAGLRTLYKA